MVVLYEVLIIIVYLYTLMLVNVNIIEMIIENWFCLLSNYIHITIHPNTSNKSLGAKKETKWGHT